MKLKQRIAAAFTALALIFTLTDPSALGGILNAAGRAFADATKIPTSEITLSSAPQAPVAGDDFWGSSAISTNVDARIQETKVNWFLDDGTNTPVSGKAGYNKKYRVVIQFRIDTSKYSVASNASVFYFDGEDPIMLDTSVKDDTYIIAEMSFEPTRLPNATGAEFIHTATIPAGSKEITLDAFKCHATDADILRALPSTAIIRTEDKELNLNATITWKTATGAFDYLSSTKYDPNNVEEQSFKIRGTVNVPSGAQVGNTTAFYYLTVNITVLAADVLPAPTAVTPEGDYTTGLSVKLNSPETIYYTISSNENGPDPQGGVESETNLKYSGGINLAGVVGSTKTYYIKAIAYNKDFRQSEVAKFVYSITLEPSELTNIPTVHLDVDPPKGGSVLDTSAVLSSDATDLEKGGIAVISSVAWLGENIHGKADYNTRYSISVEITPKNMFAFFSTPDVYINGKEAKSTTNASGTLTITYTFPEKTEKLKSFKIVNPASTVMAENGTSIANIGKLLPNMVEIEAPAGTLLEKQYPVKWDLSTSNPAYDPKKADVQQFTLTGTVTMPEYIEYSHGTNTATINVYVGQAGMLTWPMATPADSAEGERAFYEPTAVMLSSAHQNAAIYYTIGTSPDIAAPTVSGGKAYTNPIILSGTPGEIVTYYIKAISTAAGMKDSPVNTFVYTLIIPKQSVEKPTPNYTPGTYDRKLDISLNTTTAGADIYYTLTPNGNDFKKYTGSFRLDGVVNGTKVYTIRCYAKDPEGKMNDSDVVSYSFTVSLPKDRASAPYPDHAPGSDYENSLTIRLTCDTPNTEIYYTIDTKLDPAAGYTGRKYTGAFKLQKKNNDIVTYTVSTYAKSLNSSIESSPVANYTFTIGKDYGVEKIELVKRPLKYSYYLGELVNVSGGQIKVTYDDGKTEVVSMDEDMVDDFDSWVLGQQTVTISYKGCTTEYNIIVRKRSTSTDDKDDKDDDKTNTSKDDNKTDDKTDPEKTDNPDTDDETVSPPTMKGSAVKGWEQLQLKVKAADVGSRIVINLNGTTSVPADIINTAASRKATVEFVVNDMISWVVDAGALNKTVASVSVGIRSKDVYIPSVLVDSSGDSEIVRMHIYGDNKVGAMLYVKSGCKKKNHFVNLFRYNEDTRRLDFVSTSKVAPSTGLAQVKPAEEGNYVLMLDTITRLPGDADNSTFVDAKDSSAILGMTVGLSESDDTCDFNGDGFVNALDASAILRSVVGLL